MDIETLLIKAEQDGCMVVLNDIAPNRERSELVFRVPESVYDTPVAALDIDESTKSALQKQKITVCFIILSLSETLSAQTSN